MRGLVLLGVDSKRTVRQVNLSYETHCPATYRFTVTGPWLESVLGSSIG
jgi:hypothetical protein